MADDQEVPFGVRRGPDRVTIGLLSAMTFPLLMYPVTQDE
jgi:hypothetical protein